MTSAAFLAEVFGNEAHEHSQIVIWAKRSGSRWCSSTGEAAEYLDTVSKQEDVYYGVNLQDPGEVRARIEASQGHPPTTLRHHRGYASTVSAMPGLWVDIDIASGKHKKKGLPSTMEEATAFLSPSDDSEAPLPFEPSLVISSGGGLHLYWLFSNPWVLEDEEERGRAAALIRRWQDRIRTICGYTVDATHDLSRVLRPAGTINHKYGSEVTVQSRGPRYELDELMDFVEDEGTLPLVPDPVIVDPPAKVLLDPNGQPPTEKLLDLINLHPQFAQTWRRERSDLPSQSEYDLSLASMTSKVGWSPDEIAALILAHRRQANEPLKLDRPRYYQMTIAKAMSGNAATIAHDRLSERVDAIDQGESDADSERLGIYTDLSAMIGVHIIRIVRFVADPPQFRLIMEEGSIDLGGTDTLLSPHKFRVKVAGLSKRLITRFNGQQWDPIAQAILRAAIDEDLGADSTAEGLVNEWMGEYFGQHRPESDRTNAVTLKIPFWKEEGDPVIFLSAFQQWLGFFRNEKMSRRQLGIMLRSAGCSPKTIWYKTETGTESSTYCWVIPVAMTGLVSAGESPAPIIPLDDSSGSEADFQLQD